jgi:L-rhamnose isomerase / sugar isomerase
MIDQSHNLKGKIEAMIQTVKMAQELYCKAALVDHPELAMARSNCNLARAESLLQDAFATDVRHAIREWWQSRRLR